MTYTIHGTWNHSKAAEEHVNVTFTYPGMKPWQIAFPVRCRRAGLDFDSPEDIESYVSQVYDEIAPANWAEWRTEADKFWEKSRSNVTKPIFDAMAENFGWVVYNELPTSSNPARRLQDLKEAGFTIGTRRRAGTRDLEFMLVPKLIGSKTGYEYWSGALRAKIVKRLNSFDAYEGKPGNPKHLLPDHKFPEIRWDRDTRRESLEDISSAQIDNDFQLITNQRNQQKREVCRRCFDTGLRGNLFGLNFFYEGDANWAADIPRSGKAAEGGCVGCGWYDLNLWRAHLQAKIDSA